MENGIATRQQFGSPSKIIKKTIIRSRNHSFEFMSKGDKMRMSKRYLQSHMHCCNVHNQGRKTAQCPWAENLEGAGGEEGGRGNWDGEHM